MIFLMFACALALSSAAAFYSIVGLMAIFAAAPIPIMIMGSMLEVSKLVIASWLYRNWKEVPMLMKGYFTSALVILMFLTSMGIFGFLSKAHLDQTIPSGDVAAKVAILEEKIKTEKENINAARKTLTQLDSQVDAALSRTTDAAGADRSSSIRRGQAKERSRILDEIGTAQKAIATYTTEKAPISAELRKVEAEVGPIKYIAALIYGEGSSQDTLEKAVRWVTILIVSVFDPLAVIMLIAANWSLLHRRKENLPEPKVSEEKVDEPKDFPTAIKDQITDAVTSTLPEPEPVAELSPKPAPEDKPPTVIPNDSSWRSRPPK